jgi:hypothetical protein
MNKKKIPTYEEFMEMLAESRAAWEKQLAESEAKFAKQLADSQAAAERREALRVKRDKEFEEQRKKLHAEIFGTAQNIGHNAEQYFQNALAQSKTFGREKYDKVIFNLHFKGKESCEFDIFLVNGTSVAIIEAKNRIHPHFIAEIAEKKTVQFRRNFHEYKNYHLYLGVAGFSFDKTVEEEAKKYGVGIIRQVARVSNLMIPSSKYIKWKKIEAPMIYSRGFSINPLTTHLLVMHLKLFPLNWGFRFLDHSKGAVQKQFYSSISNT